MFTRKIIKPLAERLIRPLVLHYTARERSYRYGEIRIRVQPGVFHPGFFFSSKILLNYLKNIDLQDKHFLEIGAGSGLISLFAAQRGAVVTATDISHSAVENTAANARLNRLKMTVIHSDLFDSLPPRPFDIIAVNPPFFPKNPQTEAQYAWYCGENHAWFHKFFAGLPGYLAAHTQTLVVLSDVCDLAEINRIADEYGFQMAIALQKKVWWEVNYVFLLRGDICK